MPDKATRAHGALSAFEAQRLAGDGVEPTVERLRDHLPIVRVALDRLGGYLPPDIEREALEGRAILALVEAAEQVPTSSPTFAAYARLHVWKAITECLRQSHCFMADTQASLQHLSEAADRALRVGFDGAEEHLAALLSQPIGELRASLEQVASLMAAAPHSVIALDSDNTRLERRIAEAVCMLPKMEQIIVALYYFEDLTFAEIARVLSVSEQQVQWTFGRAAVLLRIHLCRQVSSRAAA